MHGSSLHVYGGGLSGEVPPGAPYGEQGDLAHMSKVYAELVLGMHARRGGYGLVNARLGIVYGPSPVEHDAADSVTVVDKFRRLAAAGAELTLDGGGHGDDRRRARGRRRRGCCSTARCPSRAASSTPTWRPRR